MKKHPGIVFTIWSIVVGFLLGFELAMLHPDPRIEMSIRCLYMGIVVYFMTYYHGKWIEAMDKKYRKK